MVRCAFGNVFWLLTSCFQIDFYHQCLWISFYISQVFLYFWFQVLYAFVFLSSTFFHICLSFWKLPVCSFLMFECFHSQNVSSIQVKYWPAFCWTPPSFFIFKWITEMKSKPRVINVSRFRIRDLKLSNHVTKLNYLPIKRKQNYLWNRYIHVSQGWWKWLLLFLAVLVSLQNWLHIKKIDDKLKSASRHRRCSWQAGVGGQRFN